MLPKLLIGTIITSLIGLTVLGTWHAMTRETASKLAEEALFAPADTDRIQAAIKLSLCGPEGVPAMRRVLAESEEAGVRAAMLDGLAAQRDWDSVPDMLAALDDPSSEVQRRAAAAINQIFNRDFELSSNLSAAERAATITHIREMHKAIMETPTNFAPES